MIYGLLVCVSVCPRCPLAYLLQKDAERWVRLWPLRPLRMGRPNPEVLQKPTSQQGAGWVPGFHGASRVMGHSAMWWQDQPDRD